MTAEDDIRAHLKAMAGLTERSNGLVEAAWNALGGDFDDGAMEKWLRLMLPNSLATQKTAGTLTNAYLANVISSMTGETRKPIRLKADQYTGSSLRNGLDPRKQWERPIVKARTAISQGKSPDEARAIGLDYAKALADTDMRLAQRAVAREVFANTDGIRGYRRVLTGAGCPLCRVAADQFYKRGDLMPIHTRCDCGVVPVMGDEDPGAGINAQYPSPEGISVEVEANDELGPMLQAQHVKISEDVASELFARAREGGFTFNWQRSTFPERGFAVAQPGHSRIIPAKSFKPEDIDAYIDDNWDALVSNERLHLGGWLDTEHDEVCFDLTELVDDKETAIMLGRNRNEQAIFDLENLEEIDTGGSGGRETLLGAGNDDTG